VEPTRGACHRFELSRMEQRHCLYLRPLAAVPHRTLRFHLNLGFIASGYLRAGTFRGYQATAWLL
jgi:hypothetical protein